MSFANIRGLRRHLGRFVIKLASKYAAVVESGCRWKQRKDGSEEILFALSMLDLLQWHRWAGQHCLPAQYLKIFWLSLNICKYFCCLWQNRKWCLVWGGNILTKVEFDNSWMPFLWIWRVGGYPLPKIILLNNFLFSSNFEYGFNIWAALLC